MNIKEMEYINEHKIYKVSDSSSKLLDKLNSEVNNYTECEISTHKNNILAELRKIEEKVYNIKKCNKTKYEIKVQDYNNPTKEELNEVIKEIKNKYIYDEAILRLINENKLLPTSSNNLYSEFTNGADVLINTRSNQGNRCYYVYLDSLIFSRFRILEVI